MPPKPNNERRKTSTDEQNRPLNGPLRRIIIATSARGRPTAMKPHARSAPFRPSAQTLSTAHHGLAVHRFRRRSEAPPVQRHAPTVRKTAPLRSIGGAGLRVGLNRAQTPFLRSRNSAAMQRFSPVCVDPRHPPQTVLNASLRACLNPDLSPLRSRNRAGHRIGAQSQKMPRSARFCAPNVLRSGGAAHANPREKFLGIFQKSPLYYQKPTYFRPFLREDPAFHWLMSNVDANVGTSAPFVPLKQSTACAIAMTISLCRPLSTMSPSFHACVSNSSSKMLTSLRVSSLPYGIIMRPCSNQTRNLLSRPCFRVLLPTLLILMLSVSPRSAISERYSD